MKKTATNSILVFFVIAYLVIWQIMTLVYWVEYSGKHDFWDTVFFGFFVAEFKGLFWIFNTF